MDIELQQLKDIHLPHAISTWPIAPGWIALFTILLGLMCFLGYMYYRRRQKQRAIRYALATLKQLKELTKDNTDNINIAGEISTLIRRTALHYFHRDEIAGLSGNDWLSFLNRSSKTAQFTEETGRLLIDAPYRKQTTIDLIPLFASTESWLKGLSARK